MKVFVKVVMVLMILVACNPPKTKRQSEDMQTGSNQQVQLHKIKVLETIQTTKYTYLRVNENESEYWVAVSKADIKPDEEFFFNGASANEMVNFHSKELDRDFPSILFVSQISKDPGQFNMQNPAMNSQMHSGRKAVPAEQNVAVEPAVGGITIAQLYASKSKYSGKSVKIRGTVVKVNNQIMGRNWIHIQDGTENGNDYDLTCTSQENVAVGDVVIFEGVIALDKNFTSGYFYPVIMEDAKSLH